MARPRKSDADRRVFPVGFRCTACEAEELEAKASSVGLTVGEFCRRAGIGRRMPAPSEPVPAINREAWCELARAAANLNQVTVMCRKAGFKTTGIEQLQRTLVEFRRCLLGLVE